MNTESRPSGDDVLHALNAVTETLGGESYAHPPADTVIAHNRGATGPEDGAMSSGTPGGSHNEQSGTPPDAGSAGGGKTPPPEDPPGGNAAAGESPDPDPGVWIVLPNGMRVNTNDLLRRSEALGESTTRAGLLKPGDIVVFNAPVDPESERTDRNRGAVFEVSGTEWINTGAGGTPQARVKGVLRSTDLSPDVTNQEVEFIGSGFGGSTVRNNVLTTDLPPYFQGPGQQQIVLDGYTFAETFRPSEEGLDSLSPNQLERQAQTENPHHVTCVEQLTALGTGHGIDIRQRPSEYIEPSVLRSDQRAYALHTGDQQTGNVITALERQNRTWAQARYLNDDGRDLLKVTLADLSNVNINKTFPLGVHDTGALSAAHVPTFTYTSSNTQGIETMQFRPGLEDAIQELGMPPHPGGRMYQPSINITPDGHVSLETTGPAGLVLRENPGLAERMTAAIHVETAPDGTRTISLGSKSYTLPSPEDIMNRIAGVVQGGQQ